MSTMIVVDRSPGATPANDNDRGVCCAADVFPNGGPPVLDYAGPHLKQQPPEISEEGREFVSPPNFTCELVLSATWSCTFGKQCSRRPYICPYTWRCISKKTRKQNIGNTNK